LPQWLSDCLSRLATGGGYGVRQHYSDDEEGIFHSRRPALLTSITEVITAADLLDRTICLHLDVIPDDKRRPEETLDPQCEAGRGPPPLRHGAAGSNPPQGRRGPVGRSVFAGRQGLPP